MNALEVTDLRKEFVRTRGRSGLRRTKKRSTALGGVTFAIERGECVAILGQNGSGKSTLVRLLSTLLLPDGGTRATSSATTSCTRPAPCGGSSTASRSRPRFFKKMSAVENLELRGALLRA